MAITGTITTDMNPTQTVTLSTASGSVGFTIKDPVSLVMTTVVVTAGGGDNATATALAAKVNDNTQSTFLGYLSAVASTNTVILTFAPLGTGASGVVGRPYVTAASGTGATITAGTLGWYYDGQAIQVTAAFVSSGVAATSVTSVENATTPTNSLIDDSEFTMVGQAIPASATTTFSFIARLRVGQTLPVTPTLGYSLVCGSTVVTSTGSIVTVAPPQFAGGIFPNDTN